MISTTICEDGTPFGKHYLDHYYRIQRPGTLGELSNNLRDEDEMLDLEVHQELGHQEQWANFKSPDGTISELFISDKTVVWSKNGHVVKVFQGDVKVTAAFATNFYSYPRRPNVVINPNEDTPESEDNLGQKFFAICILEGTTLKVYSENGDDYLISVPFEVKQCWPSKFGIIFETTKSGVEPQQDGPLPRWFCLLHPLDDFCRVVVKMKNQLREEVGDGLQIVHISKNPSICLVHTKSGQHHAFYLRPSLPEESAEVEMASSLPSSAMQTPLGASKSANSSSNQKSMMAMRRSFQFSPHQWPSNPNSPSWESGHNVSSFANANMSSRIGHKTFSVVQSPVSALASISRSPSASSSPVGLVGSTSLFLNRTAAEHTFTENPTESPDFAITLVHLWSEPTTIAKQNHNKKATKAFMAKDTMGETYLCYLQTCADQLAVVRIDHGKSGYRFGAVNHIQSISDAAFVESLRMTLVLESVRPSGAIFDSTGSKPALALYSGTAKVGKLMVNTANANTAQIGKIAQEISTLNLDSKPGTPVSARLVTSSRPPSATLERSPKFNESLALLSPVLQADPEFKIAKIASTIEDQITLKYTNGMEIRFFTPNFSSNPLVNACLNVVCGSVSNKEMALQLQAKWFSIRNAPGPTSLNPSREWKLFSQCLLGMMGYQTEHFILFPIDSEHASNSPTTTATKKARRMETVSDGDWDFLLSSVHHQETGQKLSDLLKIDAVSRFSRTSLHGGDVGPEGGSILVDHSATLFSNFGNLVYNLHLLYEELKLNKNMSEHLPYLAGLLVRLAADLDLDLYVRHYWTDFPLICPPSLEEAKTNQFLKSHKAKAKLPKGMPMNPPSIHGHLLSILKNKAHIFDTMPLIKPYLVRSKELSVIYMIFVGRSDLCEALALPSSDTLVMWLEEKKSEELHHFILMTKTLCHLQYDHTSLDTVPAVLALPLLMALNYSRMNPCSTFDEDTYKLIGRDDLVKRYTSSQKVDSSMPAKSDDGMEDIDTSEVCMLRWPGDKRVSETRKMLQSAQPVPINVTQRPDVSDHDFMEEQERCLQSICVRTLALPVGRGAFTLFTTSAMATDAMPIPKLCLTGKAPPRGTTVEMEHIDVVANMDKWSLFHNGAAAGLRMSQKMVGIDSTWITFNKPRDLPQENNANHLIEHGGFLMALGLAGHLTKLGKLESFEYMMKGDEMINIGVLLGVAASKRGTMDVLATKKVATQLVALLPPSATELPLSQVTQIAALVSLGLLYEGTGHRHMTEVCLGELGRPPGPEVENCTDRESYSLSAGLALGMITFGQGPQLTNGPLADLSLPNLLFYHIIGGPKSALAQLGSHQHHQQPGGQPQSFQVKEGDSINIDVTGPGATLALGMMFFDSNNKAIAEWLRAPETQFLLEFVRPEFLMLRTMAIGLIMWSNVHPSQEWIDSNVPKAILPYCLVSPAPEHPPNIDYETINQAYCNIISGAAMIMGLRFAGSCNQEAFDTLFGQTNRLIAKSSRSVAELAGRATIEQAICVHVVALSVVMAGSGDLEVMRIIRYLRSRVGARHSTVTYGSHMALHLALGLLFLGGGRMTLSTSPKAIAALICALYPKFPTHSNDNRYHLQALRHLYVLAAEPRLLLPKDVNSKEFVYAHFNMEFGETMWYSNHTVMIKAPVMLPELKYLTSLSLQDDRYHGFSFDKANFDDLENLLRHSDGVVFVKQKTGCLPYAQDPHGYRSIVSGSDLSRKNVTSDGFQWLSADNLLLANLFTDRSVKDFSSMFLQDIGQSKAQGFEFKRVMGSVLHECASKEKMELVSFWVGLLRSIYTGAKHGVSAQESSALSTLLTISQSGKTTGFVCPEITVSLQQTIVAILSVWEEAKTAVKVYPDFAHMALSDRNEMSKLSTLVTMTTESSTPSLDLRSEAANPLKLLKSQDLASNVLYTL